MLYVNLAVRRDYSSLGCSGSTSATPSATTTRLWPHALYLNLAVRRDYSSPVARTLRQPRRAPRVLVITLPAAAIYFAYAARPAASARHTARRVARHAARCAARHRLLRLAQARRRLLRLAQARRRLLRLRRASGCLGTSRGSSRGSSSTTSPTPRVLVPWHVARLVTWLVAPLVVDYSASRSLIVDYSVRHDFVLRPHWLYFSHVVRRDYLSRGNTGSTSSTPHAATTSSSGRIVLTIHLD
jgi:hypothetical protein